MSLEFKKSITLTGESMIDEQLVVYMNAQVSKDQSTSYSQNVQNEELYRNKAHRTTVRADIDTFAEKMYEVEDSFMDTAETKANDK